jgi:hypothetical protein
MSGAPSHPAALDDKALLAECRIGKGRSGGPGGQNRNKVETMVILTHVPTGISAKAAERRSAIENRREALVRLRLALATRHRTPVAVGDVRSELWRRRCMPDGRIVCNPRHRDYPALLAEALDVVAACRWDPRRASLRLSCTMSQLLRLLREHPAALDLVNRQRAFKGGHTLR